jgi:hypothetical protein
MESADELANMEPGKAIIHEFARRLGHHYLEIYSRYLSLGMDLQTGKGHCNFVDEKRF